jgi:acyl carrier protein
MTRIQKAIADDLGVEISMDKLLRESTVSRIAAHIDSLLAVS